MHTNFNVSEQSVALQSPLQIGLFGSMQVLAHCLELSSNGSISPFVTPQFVKGMVPAKKKSLVKYKELCKQCNITEFTNGTGRETTVNKVIAQLTTVKSGSNYLMLIKCNYVVSRKLKVCWIG